MLETLVIVFLCGLFFGWFFFGNREDKYDGINSPASKLGLLSVYIVLIIFIFHVVLIGDACEAGILTASQGWGVWFGLFLFPWIGYRFLAKLYHQKRGTWYL